MNNMNNKIQILKVKQNYELKVFCKDCEEQKKWNKKYLTFEELNSEKWEDYATNWCFEHRYENPIKLKKDRKKLKKEECNRSTFFQSSHKIKQ